MAERVVDQLEAVQVDEQHGHAEPVSVGARDSQLEVLVEHRPIWQPGQLVVIGEVGDLLLGALLQADVASDD